MNIKRNPKNKLTKKPKHKLTKKPKYKLTLQSLRLSLREIHLPLHKGGRRVVLSLERTVKDACPYGFVVAVLNGRSKPLPYQICGNLSAIRKQTIKTKPIISSKTPPIDIGEINFTTQTKHLSRVRNSNTAFCVDDQKALLFVCVVGRPRASLARGREGVKGVNPLTHFFGSFLAA